MLYNGGAEDFLREYQAHNYISDLWYHERTREEIIILAQHAIEFPGIPIENFESLISQRWLG